MGIIGTTSVKGYKPAIFRNQPVHQFYAHLQAVMHAMDSSCANEHLFARPFPEGGDIASACEIQWFSELPGDPQPLSSLPEAAQKEIASKLLQTMQMMKKYADDRTNKSGTERDYADFLKTVAVHPSIDRVFVLDNRPVIVHWGLLDENVTNDDGKVFCGWSEFVDLIKNRAAHAPARQPSQPEKAFVDPVKQAEKSSDSSYEWVKWLAVILAIIILLLLLRSCAYNPAHEKQQPAMQPLPGINGAGAGSPNGGGMPGGGGLPGGGGMPSGGEMPSGGGLPGGGSPGRGGLPGGNSEAPQQGISQQGSASGNNPVIAVEVISETVQTLVSHPSDPMTDWEIQNSDGTPYKSQEASFIGQPDPTHARTERVTVSLKPKPGMALGVRIRARTSKGSETYYNFFSPR